MSLSNQFAIPIYTVVNGALVPAGTIYQNDAGQVVISPSGGGGGGGGSGFFDSSGNPRLLDAINGGYWTLTAPAGVLTLGNFSSNP